MAVFFGMVLTLPALSSAQDCDGNPCSSGNYVYVNMGGTAWADAGPNGNTAAMSSGFYNVEIDVEDPSMPGINFTGNLTGGFFAEEENTGGNPSQASGGSDSWVQWGIERW